METTKRLMILLIVTVLVAGSIRAAEQPQAKISNTRAASCLVKVTCDPAVLPLRFETIDYLLHSSGVGGKAVRDVLDVSPDQVPGDHFMIEYVDEITSDVKPRPSGGLSSGREDGMDEYEYAMTMDMAAQYNEIPLGKPTPSTTSPRQRGLSRRTGRDRPATGRTMTAASDFPMDEQTYLFSLNIQLPEQVKPAAEEFMYVLLQNLRIALTVAFEEHIQKLKDQLKLADEEAARAEAELSEMQDRLRTISGSRILDRDRILIDISEMRNDIQRIRMEQASDQVNVDETTRQIAKIQARMQEEIDVDTVTTELKELLALQQQSFEHMEKIYKSGRASEAELADAREKLARSKIELAQRREQLSKSAGGSMIESLNSQLANYSIKATQNLTKLSNLEQQLAEADELLGKADDYELLSLKIDIAKESLQETILWRDRMSRRIRMIQPPTVSVIGGE